GALTASHVSYNASQDEAASFNKAFQKWDEYNRDLLVSLYTNGDPVIEYDWSAPISRSYQDSVFDIYQQNLAALEKKCDKLESLVERIGLVPLAPQVATSPASQSRHEDLDAPATALPLIEKICLRFHLVVGQLRSRHEERETL